MSAKENARQAWKEILGVVGVDGGKEKWRMMCLMS